MAADADPYDDTESPSREPIDADAYDDRQAEIRVEHHADQTLIAVETQSGSAAALVDVGDLPLERERQLAREVRAAFDRATRSGGDGS